jgi:ribonuclease D
LEIEENQNLRLIFNAQKRQNFTNKIPSQLMSKDIIILGERYKELFPEWRFLDSEIAHLKERVKKAMTVQNKGNSSHFKLSSSSMMKVDFASLARLVLSVGIELDFMVTLTQYIQKRLGEAINQIDVQVEYITSWRMKAKTVEEQDEEIPF